MIRFCEAFKFQTLQKNPTKDDASTPAHTLAANAHSGLHPFASVAVASSCYRINRTEIVGTPALLHTSHHHSNAARAASDALDARTAL